MSTQSTTISAETHAEISRLAAGVPLLMVDEAHVELLRQRYVGRPGAKGEERKGPEAVARFPNAKQTGGYGYSVDDNGVATVNIRGVITPEAWAWYDDQETITEWVERDLAAMENDPQVKAALFSINSPGGYVAGSYEMADAIARLAKVKPTAAAIGAYGTSAAYLQAVQSGHITAFRTSIVGSIGTRSAVIDAEQFFAKFGVKVIPIDSGGMKSAGLIGTKITPEQVEYFRSRVMKLQELFTAAVASGRGVALAKAQGWADGRVHVAGEAKDMGLIDAVGTLADAYAGLRAGRTGKGGKKVQSAAEELEQRVKVEMTRNPRLDARAARQKVLGGDDNLRQRYIREAAQQTAARATAQGRATAPVTTPRATVPTAPATSAKAEVEQRAAEKMSRHGWTRQKALQDTFATNEPLRQRYNAELNALAK